MAFLCVSQQGEFKNTTQNFLGKAHVKSFWPKTEKVEYVEKKLSPVVCRLFPSIFLSRFWAFLCVRNPSSSYQTAPPAPQKSHTKKGR
jgi:hypothetical protein